MSLPDLGGCLSQVNLFVLVVRVPNLNAGHIDVLLDCHFGDNVKVG